MLQKCEHEVNGVKCPESHKTQPILWHLYPIHRVPSPGYEIIETRAGGPFKKAIRNCLLALFGNFEHAIKPIKDLEALPSF